MKKDNKRTGFTLVELLVVIAILAVLATVSVVGYLGFTKKAHVSNDISLTTQMNTILQAEEAGGETFETPHDAVVALQNGGLDLSKLNPSTSGYNYVYDLKQNRMFLLDDTKTKVAPTNQELSENKSQVFAFVGSSSEISSWSEYSLYLKDNFVFDTTANVQKTTSKSKIFNFDEIKDTSSSKTITVSNGLDVGSNKNVTVTFNGTSSEDVIIRTQGDQSSVTIIGSGKVKFYGYAKEVKVTSGSATVVGSCNDLTVSSGGTANVEETGIVFKATVSSGASVSNSGYVASKAGEGTISGKTVGGNFEISKLSQLEAFRDTVNAGNDFSGKIVELTSDITLKDGWTPIGEGARDYSGVTSNRSNAHYFKGTFKGNNKTISNLNNKGYIPTDDRLGQGKNGQDILDKDKSYCYGFFALVDGATIGNIKFSNVDIDASRYNGANMDSTSALIGYATGNCTISGITVNGSIKGHESVGGIVGRWYNISGNVTLKDCTNNATIVALGEISNSTKGKAGGVVGFISKFTREFTASTSNKFKFDNCHNTGNVTGKDYADLLGNSGDVNNGENKNVCGKFSQESCSIKGKPTANNTNGDFSLSKALDLKSN